MKHVIPTIIAAAFSFLLGAAAHEYAWPHFSVYARGDSEMKNIRFDKWGGAMIVIDAAKVGEPGGKFDHLYVVNRSPFYPIQWNSAR